MIAVRRAAAIDRQNGAGDGMIFQGIRIVLITRAQYELAACGWLFIEDVPKVKAVRR